MEFDFNKAKELCRQANKILICSHSNPDGDAIGSVLGLYHALNREVNAELKMMVPNDFPGFLKWMPGADRIIIHELKQDISSSYIQEADLIFCLDFNDIDRVESCSKDLLASSATKILIDHHPSPKPQFDLVYSTIQTSSTAELVYQFIGSFNKSEMLGREAAIGLYTGIMTDTGSFSYLCNNESTYLAVAKLISAGVDAEEAHRQVYDTYSSHRLQLLGFCLSERLVILKKYHTAYIYLSQADLERFNYQVGDIEGVVNYPLSIREVKFAVLFREQNGKIRLSLRSKGTFAVNEFAREHFAGGGHRNAAGADSFDKLQKTLQKFEALLPQYMQQLSV
ncbi:MAG: bifunctional oligoribonuclease/PAP phosphatase NrnA [Bacteroidota bacterium]|nr:bifunctional oligoribonuclease/PAP phosphatase NrnA [Bacteroidota bacterium]